MIASRRELLRWQFELTWSLLELHLDLLVADDCTWEPAPHCWTVHQDPDGRWVPDWAETEPDPPAVPTIGWVTWHLDWWWSTAADHLRGRRPRSREDVVWPGPGAAVVDRLRALHDEWLDVLDGLSEADLDAPAPFPWPEGSGLTVAHTVAWVDAELMKNVAELGQLRLLRSAGAAGTPGLRPGGPGSAPAAAR